MELAQFGTLGVSLTDDRACAYGAGACSDFTRLFLGRCHPEYGSFRWGEQLTGRWNLGTRMALVTPGLRWAEGRPVGLLPNPFDCRRLHLRV